LFNRYFAAAALRFSARLPCFFCFGFASISRWRSTVFIRAISIRVLRSWLGSSSSSVTAWLRRSNRCLRFSSSSCFRCSVSFSRISLAVMILFQLRNRFTALEEAARDRHFVRDARQAALGG